MFYYTVEGDYEKTFYKEEFCCQSAEKSYSLLVYSNNSQNPYCATVSTYIYVCTLILTRSMEKFVYKNC